MRKISSSISKVKAFNNHLTWNIRVKDARVTFQGVKFWNYLKVKISTRVYSVKPWCTKVVKSLKTMVEAGADLAVF